jgi:hypothetical protein
MKYIFFLLAGVLFLSCSTGYYPNKTLPTDKIEMIKTLILYPEKTDSIIDINLDCVKKVHGQRHQWIDSLEFEKIRFLQNFYAGKSELLANDLEVDQLLYMPSAYIGGNSYPSLTYEVGVIINCSQSCVRFSFWGVSDIWYLEDVDFCKDFERYCRYRSWRKK